jgi:hypothetical protein
MRLFQNKKPFHLALAAVLALSALTTLGFARDAHASPYQAMVRFDHMLASTATTGMVCAVPSSTNLASSEGKVLVTFPTGYTVSSTLGNWTVNTSNSSWPSGAAAWPGIGTATNVTGQVVTFPSTDLASSTTTYCFNWTSTSAVTTGTAGISKIGTVATQTGAAAAIDSTDYATASIATESISVTATVPPIFDFALANTTDALGSLSTGSVATSSTPATATIKTNAKNGWTLWAKSAATNGGLTSASASYTIASTCNGGTQIGTNSTLTNGTEGYNTGATSSHASGSGTITVDTIFVGGTSRGGGLCGTLQRVATSSGTASSDVVTLKNNVAISGATAAATDYTDTITVVGAGLF